MTPLESEVFACVCRLIHALTPEARAEIRAGLLAADREVLLVDGDAGPISGNVLP